MKRKLSKDPVAQSIDKMAIKARLKKTDPEAYRLVVCLEEVLANQKKLTDMAISKLRQKEISMNKQIEKIITFLLENGWDEDLTAGEFRHYYHKSNYGIDIGKETGEVVVIAGQGDIFRIPLSNNSFYTLIGFLVIHPCDDFYGKYKFFQ